MSLQGKTVFITGGARGIGAETARRAAARGANIVVAGLEPDELERVAATAGAGRGAAFETDVTDRDQLKAAVDGTIEKFGSIDAVVVNAGIGGGGLVRYADPDQFEAVLRVNLIGSYRTIHATLPHLIESKGYLLQIASMAAVVAAPGMAAYSASKHGVEAMANSIRSETKHLGVDVGCAYFSWIGTEMVNGADDNPVTQKMRSLLKGPMATTYPVSMAADGILDGIEQRKRLVVVPKWARALIAIKPLAQRLSELGPKEHMAEIDRLTAEERAKRGEDAFKPVGAGGRAFTEADEKRTSTPV
jgi:NAD(P)-dependent dehydrogenase (short-subunit alcohol dehydrogenase family)